MLSPRWQKVLGDLRLNPMRSVLVVLSVAIGVFAVGTVTWSRSIVLESVAAGDAASHVAAAVLTTSSFDQRVVQLARRQPGVRDAEGRMRITWRVKTGPHRFDDLWLFAIPDFRHMRIDTIRPERGAWPPPPHEILLERSSLSAVNGSPGGRVTLERANGSQRDMTIAGTAYDLNQVATPESGIVYGYVTMDTLTWLGEPRTFNELYLAVNGNPHDASHIRQVTERVREVLERTGRQVSTTFAPSPGETWADSPVQSIGLLISLLAIPLAFMSGFLVVSIVTAMLTQHERQIGVMKAGGARTSQIAGLYLAMIFVCCVAALALAVPLSAVGARALISYTAGLLNLNTLPFSLPLGIVGIELAVGLAVPLLAALVPVIRGSKTTVREAITGYGVSAGVFPLSAWLARKRVVYRPVLLAFGNTFRQPGRLALMLTTLSLAGAIVIAVFSVRASLLRTLDDTFGLLHYDVQLNLDRFYGSRQLVRAARQVQGVTRAEAWEQINAERVDAHGARGAEILLIAPPAQTPMVRPALIRGRWLRAGERDTLVITTDVLRYEPDLRVGQNVTLSINRVAGRWRIVGLARGVQRGATAYVTDTALAHVTGRPGLANSVEVVIAHHDLASQSHAAQELSATMHAIGLSVSSTVLTDDWRSTDESLFNVIIVFLATLGSMLAITGGLGLLGMMSINVLERTREIGIMRAIGASNSQILLVVLAEGLVIGLLSWLVGTIVAIPLSALLSNALGVAYVLTPLAFRFAWSGVVFWLGASFILSLLASVLPARTASAVTVHNALSYE
jgi:putative ABC transport system permease protein